MFQARPISLKSEVWDRIDNYLNEYAAQNPGFLPNRGAFIEEAVVAYLDLKEGGGSSEEGTDESFDMDEALSDDMSLDDDESLDDEEADDEEDGDDDNEDDNDEDED